MVLVHPHYDGCLGLHVFLLQIQIVEQFCLVQRVTEKQDISTLVSVKF